IADAVLRLNSCAFMFSNQVPRFARLPRQEFRGFGVVNNLLLRRVPADFVAGAVSNVPPMCNDRGMMPDLHVRRRLLPRADALDEILYVKRGGVLGGHFLPLHAQAVGALLASGRARSGRIAQFRVNLKAEPIHDEGAVGAVISFAMRTIFIAAGLIILFAGRAPSGSMSILHGGLVAQDKAGVFISDLHHVGRLRAVAQSVTSTRGRHT